MKEHILVIEDDPLLSKNLISTLIRSGFTATAVEDGVTALEKLETGHYDLVLLDLMIPKLSGYDVLKALEKRELIIPIIVVSARGGEYDQANALDLGADDFIVKPFNAVTLESRIRAVLRRRPMGAFTLLKSDGLTIDATKRTCQRNGSEVALTKIEFDLLWLFMFAEGKTIRRVDIEDDIWGDVPSSNVLDVYMGYLRKKIGAEYFEVIRGHGIRFSKPVSMGKS